MNYSTEIIVYRNNVETCSGVVHRNVVVDSTCVQRSI